MTDAITTQGNGAVATTGAPNPFEAYANKVGGSRLTFLLFKKGDWWLGTGDDAKELPAGTQFVVDMGTNKVGWIHWKNGAPDDNQLELITDMPITPPRREMGDDDAALWELGTDGTPQDPWQLTNTVEMCDPENADDRVMYTTSSVGGRGAVNDLIAVYGSRIRQVPDEVPLIALAGDSYMHRDKKRGKVHVPVLEVVGWVDKDGNKPEPAAEPEAEAPPAKAKGGKTRF